MIFAVSNERIQWSRELGPLSTTLTVKDLVQKIKDLVQKIKVSSQEIPRKAWNLLLSQKEFFFWKFFWPKPNHFQTTRNV